jgi:hypothetical protein
MKVRFCECDYELDGPELRRLRTGNDVLQDTAALRARIASDGYLFLKGYLDRDQVLKARRSILEHMDAHQGLEPGCRPLDGVMGQYGKTVRMEGRRGITQHEDVLAVVESPRLRILYELIFGGDVATFDYKWLRAVGNEEATGCHMDHVYMGRGTKRLMTCWIPFGDIPVNQGTLAVLEGSHNQERFAPLRNGYGRKDVDIDRFGGWFTSNPRDVTDAFGGVWATDDVEAGDLLTFGMHLMHASTTNMTRHWRLSCDVRWQPAHDPMDERWAPGSTYQD